MQVESALNGIFRVTTDGGVFRKRNGQWVPTKQTSCGRGNDSGQKYKVVSYMEKGKQRHAYVHRLIAEAFIPNPDGLPQVNHKDGNPENNRAENLEWCTAQYNIQHAYRTGLINPLKCAAPCLRCGNPTTAKDQICPACKLEIKVEENQKYQFAKRRDEAYSIDPNLLTGTQFKYVQARAAGMSIPQIAEKYSVSKQCVSKAIRQSIRKTAFPRIKKTDIDHIQSLERRISRKQLKIKGLCSQIQELRGEVLELQKELDLFSPGEKHATA